MNNVIVRTIAVVGPHFSTTSGGSLAFTFEDVMFAKHVVDDGGEILPGLVAVVFKSGSGFIVRDTFNEFVEAWKLDDNYSTEPA